MAEKRTRAPKVSQEQTDRLVQYMTDHPDFCVGKMLCGRGFPLQTQMWEKLAVDLNALQGPKKDVKSWKKTWSDLKSRARRSAAAAKESHARTGNDGAAVIVTDRDQNILSVIAGESSFGIAMVECGAAVDPEDWVNPNDLIPSVAVPDDKPTCPPVPAIMQEERAALLLDEMEEGEEERHAPPVPFPKPANLGNLQFMVVTPSSARRSSVPSASHTIPSVSPLILSASPATIPSPVPAIAPSPDLAMPASHDNRVPTPCTTVSSASQPSYTSTPYWSKRRTSEPTSSSGKRPRPYSSGTSQYETAKAIAKEGNQGLTDIARSIDKLTEAVVAQNSISQRMLEQNAQTLAMLSTLG